MKTIKTSIALLVGAALLSGCNDDTEYVNVQPKEVKIATYNLSFDRATFEALVSEMQIEPAQQTVLVTAYLDGSIAAEDKTTAEKVIQIRNVAAIIQKNRPDVLMMAEYNNDGTGENKAALEASRRTTCLSRKASMVQAVKRTLNLSNILTRSLTLPTQVC